MRLFLVTIFGITGTYGNIVQQRFTLTTTQWFTGTKTLQLTTVKKPALLLIDSKNSTFTIPSGSASRFWIYKSIIVTLYNGVTTIGYDMKAYEGTSSGWYDYVNLFVNYLDGMTISYNSSTQIINLNLTANTAYLNKQCTATVIGLG